MHVDKNCKDTRVNGRSLYLQYPGGFKFEEAAHLISLTAHRKTQIFLLVHMQHWHISLAILSTHQSVNHGELNRAVATIQYVRLYG